MCFVAIFLHLCVDNKEVEGNLLNLLVVRVHTQNTVISQSIFEATLFGSLFNLPIIVLLDGLLQFLRFRTRHTAFQVSVLEDVEGGHVRRAEFLGYILNSQQNVKTWLHSGHQ